MEEPHDTLRFVLICRPRSGTHLVRTGLNQHPDVFCAWEPFNQEPDRFFDYDDRTPASAILECMWTQPVPAAGFTLHWEQARSQPEWDVWERLAADPSIRVIHLYRRNALERIVSFETALRTDVWTIEIEAAGYRRVEPVRFAIEPDRMEQLLIEDEQWRADQLAFRSDASIIVTYEELVAEYERTMKRIFTHIGVVPIPVAEHTVRIGGPVPDVVTNYDDLERRFRNTRWASMFQVTDGDRE